MRIDDNYLRGNRVDGELVYSSDINELEKKYNALENGEIETAIKIISKKESKLLAIFKAIKKLIFSSNYEKQYNED